jgi:2-keto-4-pentenoate hydratase/2-oxohepta-3-ene-1,7-dioic acid hydratase in catechol pathway
MGATIVTPDEVGDWRALTGRVRVNGEQWGPGSRSAEPQHDLGDMVAYAAEGEPLGPGDVLATGTLPGGCGLELDRWVHVGDTVELELDRVGTVTNRLVAS